MFEFGLIGYPLGHSYSPAIHRAALQALGLAGDYRLYPVRPLPGGAGDLQALLARMRTGDLAGLNVTIPHKQVVLEYLDRLTPAAQAIGAVNTISSRSGILTGDNTDAPGFLADLQRLAPRLFQTGPVRELTSPVTAAALVLGAGGAARAVTYALITVGFNVTLAARRVEQSQAIIGAYRSFLYSTSLERKSRNTEVKVSPQLSAISITGDCLADWIEDHGEQNLLIVNTTPVGMAPQTDACPWPFEIPLPDGAFIYDLVYNPGETLFISRARQAGLQAFNGLGMLIEQAALAFELWTGLTAPRPELWRAVEQV